MVKKPKKQAETDIKVNAEKPQKVDAATEAKRLAWREASKRSYDKMHALLQASPRSKNVITFHVQ